MIVVRVKRKVERTSLEEALETQEALYKNLRDKHLSLDDAHTRLKELAEKLVADKVQAVKQERERYDALYEEYKKVCAMYSHVRDEYVAHATELARVQHINEQLRAKLMLSEERNERNERKASSKEELAVIDSILGSFGFARRE